MNSLFRRLFEKRETVCKRCGYPYANCFCDVQPKQYPNFRCPVCKIISYHSEDIKQQYCGRCHKFVSEMQLL